MQMNNWQIGKGKRLPIGARTLVMGILNVTPDSFSDGSQFSSLDQAVAHVGQMIAEGADIIVVGGESTHKGAVPVITEEEVMRVWAVLLAVATRMDTAYTY